MSGSIRSATDMAFHAVDDNNDLNNRVAEEVALPPLEISANSDSESAIPLAESPIFDVDYYLASNKDVAEDEYYGAHPAQHWIEHGITEGRQGSAAFSPRAYLESYKDLRDAYGETNYSAAAQHYLDHGIGEGRAPLGTGQASDTTTVPDAIDSDFNNNPAIAALLTKPEIFKVDFYLLANPDVAADAHYGTQAGAREHWLRHGIFEGRQASPAFNVVEYIAKYDEVKETYGAENYVEAALHYANHGIAAGLNTTTIENGVQFGNDVMAFGTDPTYGTAINSLVHDGLELINNYDHGRQLQVAWTINGYGENFNPTEAGSRTDDRGDDTSSIVSEEYLDDGVLHTETYPAYWVGANEEPSQWTNVAGCETAFNSTDTSNQILRKTIEVGYDGDPNVSLFSTEIVIPEVMENGEPLNVDQLVVEAPTAYLNAELHVPYRYAFDTGGGELERLEDVNSWNELHGATRPHESTKEPFIFATEDGEHALALWTPPAAENLYSRMMFPMNGSENETHKLNVVFVREEVEPGTHNFEACVVVGDLEEVEASLQRLNERYYAGHPSVFDAGYYLDSDPKLREAGINTPEQALDHWLDHGIAEGRQAHPSFSPGGYLEENPALAREGYSFQQAINHAVAYEVGIAQHLTDEPYLNAAFDHEYYLANNGDLRDADFDTREEAIEHWVLHGFAEGRQANRDVDLARFARDRGITDPLEVVRQWAMSS